MPPEGAVSPAYEQDELQAQEPQPRQGYFPYRDEFAPRSKRLLYELAMARSVAEDARSAASSGATAADSASCFTVKSRSSAHGSAAASGVSRGQASAAGSSLGLAATASAPDLLQAPQRGPRSRLPTADSARVQGGVARRRKEAFFRCPALSAHDQAWFAEKWQSDGPVGLATAGMPPNLHLPSLRSRQESINMVQHLLPGSNSHEARTPA